MLQITIPAVEQWDEVNQEFVNLKEQTLQLEHSLVSISKWESKWNKAFLSSKEKSVEETIDYVRCMTLTKNVKPEIYNFLTADNLSEINRYIDAPMTATYFMEDESKSGGRETITSELIYYWMIALNIPFECQKWHLNRLLTLVKVCNIKNASPKRKSKQDIMRRNAKLNAERRKKMHSKG